ncbi:hypothetical protein GOP47_0027729 [Adiantum capillus-veneris]|nr:hypothetical protein GOP47_0027729 [Adiantum capillus-veneris]
MTKEAQCSWIRWRHVSPSCEKRLVCRFCAAGIFIHNSELSAELNCLLTLELKQSSRRYQGCGLSLGVVVMATAIAYLQ